MTSVAFSYAAPSHVGREDATMVVALASNRRRSAGASGRLLRDVLPLRLALTMFGGVVHARADALGPESIDPYVTVHPDRLTWEAFSPCGGLYARVGLHTRAIELDSECSLGTTTVDFSRWLWDAIPELRSSRQVRLRIEREMPTGGLATDRSVDVPDAWLRLPLEMQAAACLCSTRVDMRPVDLLCAIHALERSGGGDESGALSYVFEPGQACVVSTAKTHRAVPLHGAVHDVMVRREVRVRGRRALPMLAPLLAHAQRASAFLQSSGWPSFYFLELGAVSVVLGIQGDPGWFYGQGRDVSDVAASVPPEFLAPVLAALGAHHVMGIDALVAQTGLERHRVMSAGARLCRAGRAVYELETKSFRHRELFEVPLDVAKLEEADPVVLEGHRLARSGEIVIRSVEKRSADASGCVREVSGGTKDGLETRAVIRESGRIVFGTCSCGRFREWMMSRGPCPHMLALAIATHETGPGATAAFKGGPPTL